MIYLYTVSFVHKHAHIHKIIDLYISAYALVHKLDLSLCWLSREEAAVTGAIWELWDTGCSPVGNGRWKIGEY